MTQRASFTADIIDMPTLWCVYEHSIATPDNPAPTVVFVSWCKLCEVYDLAAANRNSEWVKFRAPGIQLTVTIVQTGEERNCMDAALKRIKSYRPEPICNARGLDMTLIGRRIGCSNGQEYENQSEAARLTGMPQGMVSRCINGGLKHVRGLKFWRINPS